MPNLAIDSYEERIQAERGVYDQEYDNRAPDEPLTQHVPSSWNMVEESGSRRIRAATGGYSEAEYLINFINSRPHTRMLSLGSGPCGFELFVAENVTSSYEIMCTDLNPQLIEMGLERARQRNLNLVGQAIDLNKIWLEAESFDLIFAHASLHHLIAFEHIFEQINKALRPDGEFVTVDITGPNGFVMWPKTAAVVDSLFQCLPDRYKHNHTRFPTVTLTPHYDDRSTADEGFECIRTQDLLNLMASSFQPKYYVPLFSLMRRFFDTMYGPNYDFAREQDNRIFDTIRSLDENLLDTEMLRPETFFAVLKRGDTAATPEAEALRARMLRDAGRYSPENLPVTNSASTGQWSEAALTGRPGASVRISQRVRRAARAVLAKM